MAKISVTAAFATLQVLLIALPALADPLPSWNDTRAEAAIIEFVERVTDPVSDDFVPAADRIAVFDNDGTLWSEQPAYFQALYALDRLKQKAEKDPSILTSDTLKAAAKGDLKGAMAGGQEGLIEILDVSHSGMSVGDFEADAREWLTTAKRPQSGLVYADMTYQPMLELLTYLRDQDFATYIVSGGGVHFIRAVSEEAYGVPPGQVVGTEGDTRYEAKGDKPTLMKFGGISFIDDKAGKPVGIDRHIGKRPIFAAGNSDGDFEMLEWTTSGEGPRFGLLVHHTDAEREFAYDREGHVGVLNKGLDEAEKRGWLVVDMAKDWNRIWSGKQ
ncbi:haloacid dehalogenase [Mesorhizobium sp. L-8-10]|uniref:HAD family hydrolase n=1 Tax=unclassified Mesorhizobium TaxID=325217 RepID=UPI0019269B66|nr:MULTISPECIES: HAD family hydrolase [unclassified Mesorhizobium]BCH20578.1 haloacid dehalogenase [Mesorhizobium sp. L-8-3]BCH28425.1 haloacid dehalogenase [Mesorhizobium sp. L-8-10]